jgi:hypothetical protein
MCARCAAQRIAHDQSQDRIGIKNFLKAVGSRRLIDLTCHGTEGGQAVGNIIQVAAGWAALGPGWAVIAPSKEEAQARYEEAEARHEEIMARPVDDEETHPVTAPS